jgi:hypothetical protein
VVSYEEAIAFLENAGVDIVASEDPSVHEQPWVIVYCPGGDGYDVFSGLFQVGEVPDAAALQALVLRALEIPLPDARFSPDATWFQVVGLQSWLWVPEVSWQPVTIEVCLGVAACATATATPLDLRVDMGDGSAVVSCDGPGVAYDTDRDYESQAAVPHCFHVYEIDSGDQPDGTYAVVATTVWNIDWTCRWDSDLDGSLDASCGGGDLGNLGRQGDPIALTVRQYQAIITTND